MANKTKQLKYNQAIDDISYLILTDSGGIQEEATCLGKRIIICRDTTERPEVVDLGFGKLVNNNILPAFQNLLTGF